MRPHLHHLNGLRYFEAAARYESFTLTADALHVTQAAVSHQIKELESALAIALFERHPRQVRLTPMGRKLAAALASAFDEIGQALRDLQRQTDASLFLAVTPSFSAKWLASRLPRFWAANPSIELHLHHTVQSNSVTRGKADAAIIWSARQPERVWAKRLFGTQLVPVCAPDLLQTGRTLRSPADLQHYQLLHEDSYDDWECWLNKAGVKGMYARQGLIIDDSNALLLAAMAGQGIALGRTALIAEDLRMGKLVRPFELTIETEGAYWLTASEATTTRRNFQALCDFLDAEIQEA